MLLNSAIKFLGETEPIVRWVLPAMLLFVLTLAACTHSFKTPDLDGLYNSMIQNENPYRNPVILIPGLLGSKLIDPQTGHTVWGKFGVAGITSDKVTAPANIALPIGKGITFNELEDQLVHSGALDRIVVNFLGYPLQQNTYAYILVSSASADTETKIWLKPVLSTMETVTLPVSNLTMIGDVTLLKVHRIFTCSSKKSNGMCNRKLKNGSELKITILNSTSWPIPWEV